MINYLPSSVLSKPLKWEDKDSKPEAVPTESSAPIRETYKRVCSGCKAVCTIACFACDKVTLEVVLNYYITCRIVTYIHLLLRPNHLLLLGCLLVMLFHFCFDGVGWKKNQNVCLKSRVGYKEFSNHTYLSPYLNLQIPCFQPPHYLTLY